jgi:hypothetical protein
MFVPKLCSMRTTFHLSSLSNMGRTISQSSNSWSELHFWPPPQLPPPSAILISNSRKHLTNSRFNSRYATLPTPSGSQTERVKRVLCKSETLLTRLASIPHQNPPLGLELPKPGIIIPLVADTIRTRSYHRAFWEEFFINLQTALTHLSWQMRRHWWASLSVSSIQALK